MCIFNCGFFCNFAGLCVLELGLLKSIQDLYNYKTSRFESTLLESMLTDFSTLYQSFPLLPLILRQMLIPDQTKRFSFKKIKKALPSFSELEIQFQREPNLMEDFPMQIDRTKPQLLSIPKKSENSNPVSRLSSQTSNMVHCPSEASRRDPKCLSNFSNYVTTSSKYSSRRTSKRNQSPINIPLSNPLKVNVTPEKLKRASSNNLRVNTSRQDLALDEKVTSMADPLSQTRNGMESEEELTHPSFSGRPSSKYQNAPNAGSRIQIENSRKSRLSGFGSRISGAFSRRTGPRRSTNGPNDFKEPENAEFGSVNRQNTSHGGSRYSRGGRVSSKREVLSHSNPGHEGVSNTSNYINNRPSRQTNKTSHNRGLSEIDRISQNLFKITRNSKKMSSRMTSQSKMNSWSQIQMSKNQAMSLASSSTQNERVIQKTSFKRRIMGRRARSTHSHTRNIFEDLQERKKGHIRSFSKTHVSVKEAKRDTEERGTVGQRKFKKIFGSESENVGNIKPDMQSRKTFEKHPLYKKNGLSDSLTDGRGKGILEQPNKEKGLGEKIMGNISGLFTKKKKVKSQRRMSYKEIMDMRESSQLWGQGNQGHTPNSEAFKHTIKDRVKGVREYLNEVEVSKDQHNTPTHKIFKQNSNGLMPSDRERQKIHIRMEAIQTKPQLMLNSPVYRIPRMSNSKPRPLGSRKNEEFLFSEETPLSNLNISRSKGRKMLNDSETLGDESEDPIILKFAKKKELGSNKKKSAEKRSHRSSSVFSTFQQKQENSGQKKENLEEANVSRMSSFSRRKNRFHEKSSDKKSRRSSKIKVHYKKLIRPVKKVTLPPKRLTQKRTISSQRQPSDANKENYGNRQSSLARRPVNIQQIKINDSIKQKTYERISPLSSRRGNEKLRSDRASSIQFKITRSRSQMDGANVLSEDSVICNISSFREFEAEPEQQDIIISQSKPHQSDGQSSWLNSMGRRPGKNTRYVESEFGPKQGNTGNTRKLQYTRNMAAFDDHDLHPLSNYNCGQKGIGVKGENLHSGDQGDEEGINDPFLFDANGLLVREELFADVGTKDSDQGWGRDSGKFRRVLEEFLKQGHV